MDLNKEIPFHNISIILNTINKTLKELDLQLSVYHNDVSNHTYLFYGSRYDSECCAKNVSCVEMYLH